jgi:integrase
MSEQPTDKTRKKRKTRRAGQIIERGDNKHLVRVYLGTDETTGKRRYHNHTVRGTKKDAQRYMNGVLRELDLGTFVEPAGETLAAYLDHWLEAAAKPRVRERTYNDYAALLRRYVREPLGAKKLATLRALDIQKVYSEMQERGLSPRIVRYTHAVLSSALKQAVRWGMLTRNPATLVQLPKRTSGEPLCRAVQVRSGDRDAPGGISCLAVERR